MAITKTFSIYDEKSLTYSPPTQYITVGIAVRMFSDLVTDKNSHVYAHPNDYYLYELGSFDDNTGFHSSFSKPRLVAPAIQFVIDRERNDDLFSEDETPMELLHV